MEIFKVVWDEETGLATVTFSPEKMLEAKKYIKSFIEDCDCTDDIARDYHEPAMDQPKETEWVGCPTCGMDPCMCTQEEPYMCPTCGMDPCGCVEDPATDNPA